MMNVTKEDFRKIVQIEKDQMRLLFETNASCPMHLMYLESGQIPARFEMKTMMINYYQNHGLPSFQDVDGQNCKTSQGQVPDTSKKGKSLNFMDHA